MNAHRLVIVAAALTIVVAAALATALATFSGQALPRSVRHDLTDASGTSIVMTGTMAGGDVTQYNTQLPQDVSKALDGAGFTFYQGEWSDPLGFVPGALPQRPASAGNTPIAEAATLSGVTGQAVLTSGHWPGKVVSGQPIPAALPVTAAALLHVSDGDVLRLKDRVSNHSIPFVITGLYRPRQVSSTYWSLDDVAISGSSTASGFTTYGPLTVPAAAFSSALTGYSGSWLALPHTASIPADELTAVASQVSQLGTGLANAQQLPSVTLTTSLPSVLNGTASDLDVARSLLAICGVLLFLLAAAALLAVARLLAGQREGEAAMLTARGATRGQLIRLATVEAIPVSVIAAVVGGVAGVGLAQLLAGSGTGIAWPDAIAATVAVAVAAALIMIVPALNAVTPGTARARRGRQSAVSGVTRAGADLALVLLAVVAGWELRHYSAVSAGSSGSYGVDPVIVIAPALALAGGTVLALRLLPAGGKVGERLAARGRRLTTALASWQISRQPLRQGGAALLVVLAVATATLALSQRQSWTRSDHDQAAFSAGADVRVATSQPLTAGQAGALSTLPGVRATMPAATFVQPTTGTQTIALDSSQAADVTLLRADQSKLPEAALFGKIQPTGTPAGLTLSGHPTGISLSATLGPASLGLTGVLVTASVEDAEGDVYQLDLGTLPADGKAHTLTASLGGGQAIYPLRLTGVGVTYTLPATEPDGQAVFTVTSLSDGPGTQPGTALRSWPASASSAELAGAKQAFGTAGPSAPPGAASSAIAGTGLAVTFSTGYGMAGSGSQVIPPSPVEGQLELTAARPPVVIPGIATQKFLSASNTSVGSTVQTNVNGATIDVKIVAGMTSFPTVSPSTGALIVDLDSLQSVLVNSGLSPAQPTQWWLATDATSGGATGGIPAGLNAALPPGSAVTSDTGVANRLLTDPLSTVPQQALLAVAITAAVLAVTGFCVSIAAGVGQRRTENALLAALGVPPRSAARQLCLEKLMLSLPAAIAGLILGGILAELLVPAITLTSSATTPVPPVLIEFGWLPTLLLALAIAVVPVLAAGLTIARRPDAAAALRTAEAV